MLDQKDEMLDADVGEFLAQLRDARKITRKVVAERMNLCANQITKYDRGHCRIPISRFFAYCRAIEMDPALVMAALDSDRQDYGSEEPAQFAQFMRAYHALKQDDREAVSNLMAYLVNRA